MSAITDSLRLLDDEVSAFAFLPAVNYLYVFWKTTNPSLELTIFSIFSVVISALGYNILVNVDFSPYTDNEGGSHGDNNTLKGLDLILPVISGLAWVALLILGLSELFQFFGGDTIWPELLVTVSLLLSSLVTSDLLLNEILPIYNGGELNEKEYDNSIADSNTKSDVAVYTVQKKLGEDSAGFVMMPIEETTLTIEEISSSKADKRTSEVTKEK